ncbi:DUF2484 family protein [Thioclava sp.]|uniref:DUF2484 family protein n=1 Tax=Thioclava sp. TaxID=1933450 RepID=UPI003AA90898
MTTPLVLACLWALCATLIALGPRRFHWAAAVILIVLAVPLLIWVGAVHGVIVALLLLAGAMSVLRWPLIYLMRGLRKTFGARKG